jgi:hypothetical protein
MKIFASNEQHIDGFLDELRTRFPEVSVKRGRVIHYLGMVFDYTPVGKVKITMDGFTSDLMKECEDMPGTADAPATVKLFEIDDSSPALSPVALQRFHSLVAKLLYMAKRTRPDLLVVVSFLTTRVLCADELDLSKLKRAIRYIRATVELGITLDATKFVGVVAYIDASYGVHKDCRGHTGVVIALGRGPIFAASSKQKINTKSSTECELVGLSDKSGEVIWVSNFLGAQDYDLGASKVCQDNTSTMALVKNGKSNSSRTRHIAIRYFWVADRVASKEIRLEYLRTEDMLADILSKPLVGAKFTQMRDQLLNC